MRPVRRRTSPRQPARAALAVAGLLAVSAAMASTAGAFSIKPNPNTGLDGKVVLAPAAERITTDKADGGKPIGPGMTVTRYVLLQNRMKKRTSFSLDVAQVVGSSAEEVVDVRNGIREGAASWVTIERTAVDLNPGDTATIAVDIAIPKKVTPGSKAFAITATQSSAPTESEGAGVAPIFRQVAIFIVDLPGAAPIKGRFTKLYMRSTKDTLGAAGGKKAKRNRHLYIGKHKLTLVMEYRNDGERLLTPQGEIEVRDLFNRVIARYSVPKFTVYPEGYAAQEIALKKIPPVGVFRVIVNMNSDAGQQKKVLPRFLLAPTWLLWVIGLVAFTLVTRFAWGRWQDRRYAKWLAQEEAGEFDEDDFDEDLDLDDEPFDDE